MLHCSSVVNCLQQLPEAAYHIENPKEDPEDPEMKEIAQVAEATVMTAVTKLSRFLSCTTKED